MLDHIRRPLKAKFTTQPPSLSDYFHAVAEHELAQMLGAELQLENVGGVGVLWYGAFAMTTSKRVVFRIGVGKGTLTG